MNRIWRRAGRRRAAENADDLAAAEDRPDRAVEGAVPEQRRLGGAAAAAGLDLVPSGDEGRGPRVTAEAIDGFAAQADGRGGAVDTKGGGERGEEGALAGGGRGDG